MVNFLLKHGANVNAKTKVKNFPLLCFYSEHGNPALLHDRGAFPLGSYNHGMGGVNIWCL